MKQLTINDFEFEGMCPDGKKFIWEQTQGEPFDPRRLARRYCEEGGQAYALAYVIMLWCVRHEINAGEWLDRLISATEAARIKSPRSSFEVRSQKAAMFMAEKEAWSATEAHVKAKTDNSIEWISQAANAAEAVAYWAEAIIGTEALKAFLFETIDNLSQEG